MTPVGVVLRTPKDALSTHPIGEDLDLPSQERCLAITFLSLFICRDLPNLAPVNRPNPEGNTRLYSNTGTKGAITTGCMPPFVPRTNKNEIHKCYSDQATAARLACLLRGLSGPTSIALEVER